MSDWDESLHPRATDGKFGAGSGHAGKEALGKAMAAKGAKAPKAPKIPKPRAKFDATEHDKAIAAAKTKESLIRNHSIKIKEQMAATKLKAREAKSKEEKAKHKETFAKLGAKRDELKGKATEARAARIAANKAKTTARAEYTAGRKAEREKAAAAKAKAKADKATGSSTKAKETKPSESPKPPEKAKEAEKAKAPEEKKPRSSDDLAMDVNDHINAVKDYVEDLDWKQAEHHVVEARKKFQEYAERPDANENMKSILESQTKYLDDAIKYGKEYHERNVADGRDPSGPEKGALSSNDYRKMAEKYAYGGQLTPADRATIRNYTNHSDKILNPMLRASGGKVSQTAKLFEGDHAPSGVHATRQNKRAANERMFKAQSDPSSHTVAEEVKRLDAAIAAHKMDRDAIVYRTVADPDGKITGNLKVGSTMQDHAYVSTSASKKFIDGFAEQFDPEHRVDYHISLKKGQAGAPINELTEFSQEKEILLPRSTEFRVSKIVPASGWSPKQVHLEVV